MKPAFLKFSFTFFLLLCYWGSGAQTITTFAGTGIAGYSGDGGQATAAQLYSPYGLAIDHAGNLYIAERINNIIRKITPSGVISTYAGNNVAGYSGDGGPATNARLNTPYCLAFDRNDNLFFTDNGNNAIRKIDRFGVITTVHLRMSVPLYPRGTVTSILNPTGIAINDVDVVYFSNNSWRVVLKFDDRDTAELVAGDGSLSYLGDGGLATMAALNNPYGLACDHVGNVYIADNGNNVVRKVNSAGIITTFAGNGFAGGFYGDGGPATNSGLFGPIGIATDRWNNLYIQDIYNRRIRQVNTAGIIHTLAGNGIAAYSGDGGPATAASFYNCTGLAVDMLGDFYISDLNYSVIRKVTADVALEVKDAVTLKNTLSAYPNPSNGSFSITGSFNGANDQDVDVEIYNIAGQVVYSRRARAQQGTFTMQIELSNNIANGIYLLRAHCGNFDQLARVVIEN